MGLFKQVEGKCQDETIRLIATGEEFPEYRWYFNGKRIEDKNTEEYTPYLSGVYSVQSLDTNNCPAFSQPVSVDLSQDSTPGVSYFLNPDRLKCDPAASYQWYVDNYIIVEGTQQELPLYVNGTYKVRTTNSEGCIYFSDEIEINTGTLYNFEKLALISGNAVSFNLNKLHFNEIYAFPVPATEEVTVRLKSYSEIVNASVLNTSGQEVLKLQLEKTGRDNFGTKFQSRRLTPGVYLIKVTTLSEDLTKRIIIQ